MSRTITVELSNESINHAIRELRAYRQRLEDGVSQFCQRLAELGAEILNVTYSNATYAGTNDITVSVEPGTNVATLKADGSTVAFIEFGTGVNYPIGQYAGQAGAPPHAPTANTMALPAKHGHITVHRARLDNMSEVTYTGQTATRLLMRFLLL